MNQSRLPRMRRPGVPTWALQRWHQACLRATSSGSGASPPPCDRRGRDGDVASSPEASAWRDVGLGIGRMRSGDRLLRVGRGLGRYQFHQ
jgi:hypothetical protein